jgi:4-carboxymuconolactone decarboxylase
MPRLPYKTREDLPETKRHIYDRIAETRSGDKGANGMPRVFQLILNNPDAAQPVAALGEYLRFGSSLDAAIRETTILSVAREMGSQYEWAHHEPIARRVGVRDEVIEAIRSGKAPMGLPPKEGVFAQVAKEMVIGKGLSDRTFQAVEHLLGPEQTVELIVLVGYYSMLSRVMDALGIELEPGVEPGLPESA